MGYRSLVAQDRFVGNHFADRQTAHEPCSSGRESAPSNPKQCQSRLTSAATVQGCNARICSGDSLLGALASRQPVGSRKLELAGETPVVAELCPGKPALPGTAPRQLLRNFISSRTSRRSGWLPPAFPWSRCRTRCPARARYEPRCAGKAIAPGGRAGRDCCPRRGIA